MSPVQWLWTPTPHDDHTEDVIAEAERTRKDLKRLTNELAEYTADLRAHIRHLGDGRHEIEGATDGGP